MWPKIISFYTPNTFYQISAEQLIASCEQHGLEYCIEPLESLGSWELNCGFKPLFILQKLQQFKSPLLWVDADGVFLKKPHDLKYFNCDLAVRINKNLPDDHLSKAISGTVFVNYTEKGVQLLKAWAEECMRQLSEKDRKNECWDQVALWQAIITQGENAKVQALPISYMKIAGHPLDELDDEEPILLHHQASRALKKTINSLPQ